MQRFDEDHAIQAFHHWDGDAKPRIEQQIDAARTSKDQLQRYRAHEGRHDQRQYAEGLDDERAAKLKPNREIGERDGNQGGK